MYVIKIYVGINATAQEVFFICIQPLGVLLGVVLTSVGINATVWEVFSIDRDTLINLSIKCYCALL